MLSKKIQNYSDYREVAVIVLNYFSTLWYLGIYQVFLLFQHVDVAALLIKYNACVNATDKWAFTPLHEAAQKGRTQLCALLLAHGADPTLKNQEGQTPLDLVTVSNGAPLGKSVLTCL